MTRLHGEFTAPKALSLDFDDTLLDGRGIDRSVSVTCERVANALTGVASPDVRGVNAKVFGDYWPSIEDQWLSGVLDSASVGREIWRRTLAGFGCTDPIIIESAFQSDQRFDRNANVLFDDVQMLLDFAQEHKLRLALVTNGPGELQRWKLKSVGLEDRFYALAISGEEGVAKPNPLIFTKVLEALDVEGHDVWHIGDSLSNDVVGARAAGLTAVWLNRFGDTSPSGDESPDIEVASLSGLIAVLESLYP